MPTDPVDIPVSADNLAPFSDWQVLGNDTWSDCVAVAWANTRRLVTSKLGLTELYPTLDEVLAFYKTQNPKFDPQGGSNDGPGSIADDGMIIQTGLEYLHNNKGPDGVAPIAFAKVDTTNMEDVEAALATFGSLWLGIVILDNNYIEWKNHQPWAVNGSSQFKDRHSVIAGAYNPNIHFVTWGGVTNFTQDYWNGSVGGTPLVEEAWVVIWPEHVGTRRFMVGVDFQQLATEYQKVTGISFQFPVAPFNSLYRAISVRENNTAYVAVQDATADDSYATSKINARTPIALDDLFLGTWVAESNDVYLIKTKQCASNTIEIHRLFGSLGYTGRDLLITTAFPASESSNGTFTIDNGDLYFIKTQNVGTGFVEVKFASHQKGFNSIDYDGTSTIQASDASNGYLTVSGGDLYLIKTRNVASGKVEVYIADGDKDYKNLRQYVTGFDASEDLNGTWTIGTDANLYFIKTQNTDSHRVEVQIATTGNDYRSNVHFATVFTTGDGFWCV